MNEWTRPIKPTAESKQKPDLSKIDFKVDLPSRMPEADKISFGSKEKEGSTTNEAVNYTDQMYSNSSNDELGPAELTEIDKENSVIDVVQIARERMQSAQYNLATEIASLENDPNPKAQELFTKGEELKAGFMSFGQRLKNKISESVSTLSETTKKTFQGATEYVNSYAESVANPVESIKQSMSELVDTVNGMKEDLDKIKSQLSSLSNSLKQSVSESVAAGIQEGYANREPRSIDSSTNTDDADNGSEVADHNGTDKGLVSAANKVDGGTMDRIVDDKISEDEQIESANKAETAKRLNSAREQFGEAFKVLNNPPTSSISNLEAKTNLIKAKKNLETIEAESLSADTAERLSQARQAFIDASGIEKPSKLAELMELEKDSMKQFDNEPSANEDISSEVAENAEALRELVDKVKNVVASLAKGMVESGTPEARLLDQFAADIRNAKLNAEDAFYFINGELIDQGVDISEVNSNRFKSILNAIKVQLENSIDSPADATKLQDVQAMISNIDVGGDISGRARKAWSTIRQADRWGRQRASQGAVSTSMGGFSTSAVKR